MEGKNRAKPYVISNNFSLPRHLLNGTHAQHKCGRQIFVEARFLPCKFLKGVLFRTVLLNLHIGRNQTGCQSWPKQ